MQLTADVDLVEVARHLPYLHELGVDWVYLSPVLAAEPGSEHGYDVARHDREDPERGGATGLELLAGAAHGLDMGLLVDIVPNHVGVATPAAGDLVVGPARARSRLPLRDVLRRRLGGRGRAAPAARRG